VTFIHGHVWRHLATAAALVTLLGNAGTIKASVADEVRGAQSDDELDLTLGDLPGEEPKGGYFAAATGGACLDTFPIKAGTTANGKKLYYLPEDAGYPDVAPGLCFQIEAGAQFAGFERVNRSE
jgi:hypothetical protein